MERLTIPGESQPLVSILIPTLDSGKTLAVCLQAIRMQTYKQIEVLVIDGGGSDNTVEIAEKYGANVKRASIRNRSVQRNVGALYAKGELLFYVDSDEVLHPNLVEECVRQVKRGKLDGLFIPTIDTGSSYFGKSRSLGDVIHIKFDPDLNIPNSALRFFSKSFFTALNGYNDKLVMGEDVVMALIAIKQKYRLGRCKYPMLHYATEGFCNILVKKFSYGKTFRKFEAGSNSLGYSPKIRYVQVGMFFIKNFAKQKKYARYLPGYILVKAIELSGIALGTFMVNSHSNLKSDF